MLTSTNYNAYSGAITAKLVDTFGQEHTVLDRHNTITYTGATVMSYLLSGDINYRPVKMGFIYAPNGSVFTDPGDPRLRTMATIRDAIGSQSGNMIISSLQSGKSFETSGNSEYYNDNAVTFNAITDPNAELAFSGGSFANAVPQAGSDSYYQCVLLADPKNGVVEDMLPFAIANLSGSGLPAQTDYQLAIYWTITFQ